MDFVNLHNHTMHSALDGLQRVGEMVDAAVADGQKAVAVTDHGTLGGAWELAQACRRQGIKPIFGLETYLAVADETRDERSRFDPKTILVPASDDFDGSNSTDVGDLKKKSYEHLTLLVKNKQGWRNLVAMFNDSYQNSFYRKPLMDYHQFENHHEGLIVGTGCLGGPVAGNLLRGDYDQAERELTRLVGIFGKENVFVEVMYHGIPAEDRVLPDLVKLARQFDLLVVATNDCHYTRAEDAEIHDAWLCISQKHGSKNVTISDQNRFKFNGSGYHMRTAQEMHDIFDHIDGCEDAVSNSVLIADMVEDNVLDEGHVRLPKFNTATMDWKPVSNIRPTSGAHVCDDGVWSFDTNAAALYSLVRDGAATRYGIPFSDELKERLRRELDVIESKGFVDYFLIVWDFVDWARSDRGMPTPDFPRGEPGGKEPIIVGCGRGSGPGSVIAYCTGITAIEPLANGLLFERFLDASRLDFPDFDIDFESERRDEVTRYIEARWGADRVALLGTWDVNWAKSSVQSIGRVYDMSYAKKLASTMVVGAMAEKFPLAKILDPVLSPENSRFQDEVADNPEAQFLVEKAQKVEGIFARPSIHACGLVIGDEDLTDMIPMRWQTGKVRSNHWVTQWSPDNLGESGFGLIKFDLLAIKNLDIVASAIRMIAKDTGEVIDPNALSFTDKRAANVWKMLAEGRTSGVFQLSSSGMTELCMAVGPESYEDISALVALYRPGPMGAGMHQAFARRKRGTEAVSYTDYTSNEAETEVIKSVLSPTLGLIVYQESLMELARKVADFSDIEVNALRRAFSKKKRDVMNSLYERWIDGGMSDFRRTWLDHGADFERNADQSPRRAEAKVAFAKQTLDKLWVTFEASSEYLFNASHSYAYGYNAYLTAWLKANFPAHFAAAMLLNVPNNASGAAKRRGILADLEKEGVEVLSPDINLGQMGTSVGADGKVRIGLSEIIGVGSAAESIIAERDANGPFTSLLDLTTRVKVAKADSLTVTKLPITAIEGLIDAGALDAFGTRMGLSMVARAPEVPVPDMEWGAIERSARQRRRIFVSLDTSPLLAVRDQLSEWREPLGRGSRPVPLQSIPESDNVPVVTLGVVASVETKKINGGDMLLMTLEGSNRAIDVKMWPRNFSSVEATPRVGEIFGVTGKTNVSEVPGSADELEEGEMTRLSIIAFELWQGELHDTRSGTHANSYIVSRPSIPAGPPEPAQDVEPRASRTYNVVLKAGLRWVRAFNSIEMKATLKGMFPEAEKWFNANNTVGESQVFTNEKHNISMHLKVETTYGSVDAALETAELVRICQSMLP